MSDELHKARPCTSEELAAEGGPVLQLFTELIEGAAKASGIPGYAVIAIAPDGTMSSVNGGTDEYKRDLCAQMALAAGNALMKRVLAGTEQPRPRTN